MFHFRRSLFLVLLSLFMSVVVNPTSSHAAGIEGKPCFQENATRVDSGIHYYCFPIHGEGLYWWRDYVLSPTKKVNPTTISNSKLELGIRKVMLENCQNLSPSFTKFKFKKVGKGPSSGGNPGTIYSLGSYQVVVYDAKELGYNFGPNRKSDYKKANLWGCPWDLFIER